VPRRPSGQFWIAHALVPLSVCALCFLVIVIFHLDERVARGLFFDEHANRWLGSGSGEWWARDLLHTGGRNLVRAIAAGALATWLLGFRVDAFRRYQRVAGYVALSMIVATASVGALKSITNVDCPWDVQGFGGTRPHLGIFAARPDYLPRAKCFPGAHSSSGFAVMAFYFALRDRRPRAARIALAAGLLTGSLFAFGQQARGAHFLSHDLASAGIVWGILLALYVVVLRGRRLERPSR
jgi:membrane-associated PAP2 superfamily phosphatase